jgi:hypothetical protein
MLAEAHEDAVVAAIRAILPNHDVIHRQIAAATPSPSQRQSSIGAGIVFLMHRVYVVHNGDFHEQ